MLEKSLQATVLEDGSCPFACSPGTLILILTQFIFSYLLRIFLVFLSFAATLRYLKTSENRDEAARTTSRASHSLTLTPAGGVPAFTRRRYGRGGGRRAAQRRQRGALLPPPPPPPYPRRRGRRRDRPLSRAGAGERNAGPSGPPPACRTRCLGPSRTRRLRSLRAAWRSAAGRGAAGAPHPRRWAPPTGMSWWGGGSSTDGPAHRGRPASLRVGPPAGTAAAHRTKVVGTGWRRNRPAVRPWAP